MYGSLNKLAVSSLNFSFTGLLAPMRLGGNDNAHKHYGIITVTVVSGPQRRGWDCRGDVERQARDW